MEDIFHEYARSELKRKGTLIAAGWAAFGTSVEHSEEIDQAARFCADPLAELPIDPSEGWKRFTA